MEQHCTSPVKKQRVELNDESKQAGAAHEWTGNAAIISNVVRFLPTGQDVLRCELVNSTWRSSAMCALLPPISLTTEALNKTSPPCLSRNGSRLASLRAAFIIEPVETNTRHRNDIRASNRAAMEAVAAAATNLGSLVVNNVGYNFQDDVWSRLTSLTRLELHTSSGGSLPASLAALTGLQHLRINNFRGLRLSHLDEATSTEVHWLQQLTRLTTLSATYIHIFGEGVYMGGTFSSPLPASLQELELDHIPHFDDLKVDMAALTDLRSFTISGKMKQLPAELGSLQQLSRLCFSKCDSLEQLPGNLGQSPAVKSVSVICNTRDREYFKQAGLPPPGYLAAGGMQGMPSLTSLAISIPRCSCMYDGLTPTASISCLTSLNVYYSPALRSGGEHGLEEFLAGLTSLRCLQLSGIAAVESLEAVAGLTALTSLSISGAEGLVALPSFEQLRLLVRVELKGCSKVKVLSGVQGLTSLQHLTLQDMMSLGSLPAALVDLACLQELVVYFCTCVRKFPASLLQLRLRLLSISSLNERCLVARKLMASAKQRGAYRYPIEMGMAGGAVLGGYGMLGGAL